MHRGYRHMLWILPLGLLAACPRSKPSAPEYEAITLAELADRGGPLATEMARLLRDKGPGLTKCLSSAKGSDGRVAVELTIYVDASSGSGSVARADVHDVPSTADKNVEACVTQTLVGWGFATTDTFHYAVSVPWQGAPPPVPSASESSMPEAESTEIVGYDKRIIDAVVERRMDDLRGCYEAQCRCSAGTCDVAVLVSFAFSAEVGGRVTEATTHVRGGPCEYADALQGCVSGVFQTMRFPSPQGGVVKVNYPLLFQTQQKPD